MGIHSHPAIPDLDNADTTLCRANLSKFWISLHQSLTCCAGSLAMPDGFLGFCPSRIAGCYCILLSLACPRLQGCAPKIIRPNYTPKAILPKPCAQNHTPKTIRPKPNHMLKPTRQKPCAQNHTPKSNTPKAKLEPYAQNHTPKTICPKAICPKANHTPKPIHPKLSPQNHTPQTIRPKTYAQNHAPKTILPKPYAKESHLKP